MMANATRPTEILSKLGQDPQGVYFDNLKDTDQAVEIEHRSQEAASEKYSDYIRHIGDYNSVPVMDEQVKTFLKHIPRNGKIIDVGGGWGWHWRFIAEQRPDVSIFIIDLIRAHFDHAQKILKDLVNKNIFLIHGNANHLPFEDGTFDGYWTVQTLQSIPDETPAVREARRVLKKGGIFRNYAFNDQWLHKKYNQLRGREYISDGMDGSVMYLRRGHKNQVKRYSEILGTSVEAKFSEILFHPDLHLASAGQKGSLLGRVDSKLSILPIPFSSYFARQICFQAFI